MFCILVLVIGIYELSCECFVLIFEYVCFCRKLGFYGIVKVVWYEWLGLDCNCV